MPRDLTNRLLTRIPLLVRVDHEQHRAIRDYAVSECGHARDANGPFYQLCAPCGEIPHPRTNPRALENARKRKA